MAQFQSGNQYGAELHWASKCGLVNNTISCDPDASPAGHELAEMPREYHQGNDTYGDLFNYYAATAESAKYTDLIPDPKDSVCPKGWMLTSKGEVGENRTMANLLNYYDLTFNNSGTTSSNVETMFSATLSSVFSNMYAIDGTLRSRSGNNDHFSMWYTSPKKRNYYSEKAMFLAGYFVSVSDKIYEAMKRREDAEKERRLVDNRLRYKVLRRDGFKLSNLRKNSGRWCNIAC